MSKEGIPTANPTPIAICQALALIPPCPAAVDIDSDDGVIIADEVEAKEKVAGGEGFRLEVEAEDIEDRVMVGTCEVWTPSVF
jgi:hypothetical protein